MRNCAHGNFATDCDECAQVEKEKREENERKARCPQCGSLKVETYYVRRIRDAHRDETSYHCRGCDSVEEARIAAAHRRHAQNLQKAEQEAAKQRRRRKSLLATATAGLASATIVFALLPVFMPALPWAAIIVLSALVGVWIAIPFGAAWRRWIEY